MLCARFAGADKDVVVPWCRVEDLLPSRHAEELRSRQTDLSNAYWDEVDREGMAKEGRQPEVEELQSAEEECLVLEKASFNACSSFVWFATHSLIVSNSPRRPSVGSSKLRPKAAIRTVTRGRVFTSCVVGYARAKGTGSKLALCTHG